MKSDWQSKSLGEVCDFINRGISPKYLEDGGVCVVNQKCVRGHEVNFDLARRHDHKTKAVNDERFLRVGDVLVNSTGTGTLGRVAQLREEPTEKATVDSHITIVRPKSGLFHPDFFGYALVSIEEQIKEGGEGCGGQTELARSVLVNRFQVSYPSSTKEQQRIVAILDEAFDGIATAKADAEKNLQNARELFESHLQSVFSQRAGEWIEKPLADLVVATCTLSYGIVQPGDEVPDGLPIVRPTDLTTKVIEIEGLKRIDPKLANGYQRTKLSGGELLLCVRGSTGVVSVASDDLNGANVTRGIVPINFDSRALLQSFGYYALVSPIVQKQIKEKTYGTALMQINIRDLRNISFAYPSLSVQEELIAQFDSLHEETQRLESLYQRKLAALAELKKSLLHQAFSGNL